MKYITFLVNGKIVGIKKSEYDIEPTLINKLSQDIDGEFIKYKRERIRIIDTGKILFNVPLKKFDGLIFIRLNEETIAYKTEGFFKNSHKCDVELNP